MSVEVASKALAKRKACFVKQLGESTSRRDQRHRRENMTEEYLQRMMLLQFPSSGPHASH
ncbi:hypothetical protein N7527_002680 [Penicillium freii]|nr:hypothetical protein N7527_002680 [Penicillium freii]